MKYWNVSSLKDSEICFKILNGMLWKSVKYYSSIITRSKAKNTYCIDCLYNYLHVAILFLTHRNMWRYAIIKCNVALVFYTCYYLSLLFEITFLGFHVTRFIVRMGDLNKNNLLILVFFYLPT